MQEPALHRDVEAGGVRLRVVERGAGPPMLLLHDLFMDHTTWLPLCELLGTSYRLIAPDLPGFGESEKPAGSRFPYGLTAFVEAITDLYAALAVGPSVVVGHGLGGAVALNLAAQRPELVSRLVVVAPLCYEAPLDGGRRTALVPLLGGLMFRQLWGRRTFRRFFRDRMLSSGSSVALAHVDHYYDRFNTPAARGSALATLRATVDTRTVAAHLARITAPTLILWGRQDRLLPSTHGQRLSRQLRRASFESLDAGHCPQEERPQEVARSLLRFLGAPAPSGR